MCPWEGSSAVSPGPSSFYELQYNLRVNRLARWCSLVTRERLRLNKRMFFLESFNGDLVAREFDRHWSQHERSFNLHRSIWLIFEIQSPKTSIIPSKTECRPAGWRSFDKVRTYANAYSTLVSHLHLAACHVKILPMSHNVVLAEFVQALSVIWYLQRQIKYFYERALSFSSYKISLFCTVVLSIFFCNRYYLPRL